MHPDLVAISNLYAVDKTQDHLRHEHEQLVSTVQHEQKALADNKAAKESADAELAAAQKADRENTRELEGYIQKRDNTKRLMDSGASPNYEASLKQYEACAHIVDDLETKSLELMDRVESAQKAAAAAAASLVKTEKALADARAALGARDAPIRTELTAVLADREPLFKLLQPDVKPQYMELRRKKRPVLVNTVEGTCSTCHTRVPQQRIIEVQLDRALHTCPGCGGFLLPGQT